VDITSEKVQYTPTVVGLSSSYKVGDTIAGGVIVQVDYRPMPTPGRENILSGSRVILRIGNEYWAIERGGTFAQRHKLKPEQLPPGIAQF
jgi:hypothetical protein